MTDAGTSPPLTFRRADEDGLAELVRLREAAARWQIARAIEQGKPGELRPSQLRTRPAAGERWIAAPRFGRTYGVTLLEKGLAAAR